MSKRVFVLMGLAILAVVLSHAGGWGQIAMFLWTDKYVPGASVPDWDQLGSLAYFIILTLRQLAIFCVPAFLFGSGFFVAYTARGSQSALSWKVIWGRVKSLLPPYVIWSVVAIIIDVLLRQAMSPGEYLLGFLSQGVRLGYYYVPLLCYLYALSLLIVPLARTRPRLLLVILALVQLTPIALAYLEMLGVKIGLLTFVAHVPGWLLTRWILFFGIGIVGGLHLRQFDQWLVPRRWIFLAATVVFLALNIYESHLLLSMTRITWGAGVDTITFNLFAVALVLCFMAFYKSPFPLSGSLYKLSARSYGIYLIHFIVGDVVAKSIYHFAPWALAYSVLFVLLMYVVSLGGPLLLMETVARSPARRAYRYLFG